MIMKRQNKKSKKRSLAEIEEEDGPTIGDDASLPGSARGDEPSIESVETVDDAEEDADVIVDDPPMPPADQNPSRRANSVPTAVRGLDSNLNGLH